MKIGAELGEPPWRVYKLWAEGRLQGVWKDGRDLFGSARFAALTTIAHAPESETARRGRDVSGRSWR